ncbi:hypothetical protein JCM10212_001326 [Sporobolomyces blumeae]
MYSAAKQGGHQQRPPPRYDPHLARDQAPRVGQPIAVPTNAPHPARSNGHYGPPRGQYPRHDPDRSRGRPDRYGHGGSQSYARRNASGVPTVDSSSFHGTSDRRDRDGGSYGHTPKGYGSDRWGQGQGYGNGNGNGNWKGRGAEGFGSTSSNDAAQVGRGWTDEGEYNGLSRTGGDPRAQFDDDGENSAKQARMAMTRRQREQQEERERHAEAAARRQKEQEEQQSREVDAALEKLQKDRREERQEKKRAKEMARASSSAAVVPPSSASTSSTFARGADAVDLTAQRAEAQGEDKPVQFASAINRMVDFLSKAEGKGKTRASDAVIAPEDDDDDDELMMPPSQSSQPARASQTSDKGKGKAPEGERAPTSSQRSVVLPTAKKKPSVVAQLRRKNSAEDPKTKPHPKSKPKDATKRRSISLWEESPRKPPRTPPRPSSPTLAERYLQERDEADENDAIDSAIKDADRESRAKKGPDRTELGEDDGGDLDLTFDDDLDDVGGYRDDSDDELLEMTRDDIDPSSLCPFCDSLLPPHPSERLMSLEKYLLALPQVEPRTSVRNPHAKYLPIVTIASFCQLHKEERTVIPEGEAKGYPTEIDWDGLPKRIERDVTERLTRILTNELPSAFFERAKQDWERHGGFKRSNVTAEWDSFHFEEPGYYGPRGFECILSTLKQFYTNDVPLLEPERISPLSPDFYVRRVLVPETALELIRKDRDLDDDDEGSAQAMQVLDDSRPFGKAVWGIVEDDFSKPKEDAEREEAVKRKLPDRASKRKSSQEEKVVVLDDDSEPPEAVVAGPSIAFRTPKVLAAPKRPPTPPASQQPSGSAKQPTLAAVDTKRRRSRSPDEDGVDAAVADSKAEAGRRPEPRSRAQTTIESAFAKFDQLTAKAKERERADKAALVLDLSDVEAGTAPTSTSKGKGKAKDNGKQAAKKRERSSSTEPEIESPKKKKKTKALAGPASSSKRTTRATSASLGGDKSKDKNLSITTSQDKTKKKKSLPTSSRPLSTPSASTKPQRPSSTVLSSDIESEVETNIRSKNQKAQDHEKARKKLDANQRRSRAMRGVKEPDSSDSD